MKATICKCDSCGIEERHDIDESMLYTLGSSGVSAVGWAHVDLMLSQKATQMAGISSVTDTLLKELGDAVPSSVHRAYKEYAGQMIAEGPSVTHRRSSFDLCSDCSPKILAFLATMGITSRPLPEVGLGDISQ